MNESALILDAFVDRLRARTVQTNPAVEQNKNVINGPRVRGISPVRRKSPWRKGFAKRQVLSLKIKVKSSNFNIHN